MISFYADETPDAVRRSCYDCRSLRGAVSLWCTNDEAVKWRGTQIPGVTGCTFWTPMRMRPKRPKPLWARFREALRRWWGGAE